MLEATLSRKVSKGVVWVTVAKISARFLRVVSAVILARLLAPSDFGLMAIAMAVVSLTEGITVTGFSAALIQKQKKTEELLNVTWTFELVRCLVLFLILFSAAPLFASFFNEPRATLILQVIAFSLVFQGLRNVGVIYFRINLDFHKQFVLEIVPLIANISVVIPLAFVLRNVWALVCASLTSRIATCVISYVMHPYRPRLEFEIKKAKELFNFGKWILGTSILAMIREQGVTMFVGKFLGMSILGFYNRAGAFSIMLFRQIVAIVWQVGYPLYSQLQSNPVKFRRAFIKTLQLLTFLGIPMAGGLFVLSRDFTHLFLTDKWLPIVPLIQILCLLAVVTFVTTPAGILFYASGRPSINTKIAAFGLIILASLIYPLSLRWGVVGTVSSLFLSVLLLSPIIWYVAIKTIKCSFPEFVKPVLFSLINMAVMVSTIFVIKRYIFPQVNIASFFGLVFAGMMIYLVVACFLDKYLNYGMYRLVRERIAVLK